MANNISGDKWLAVVEQATTPRQHVHTCSVQEYAGRLGGKTYVTPALVIIGKVVQLHEQFAWVTNSGSKEDYFDPVQGKWIAAKTKAARA